MFKGGNAFTPKLVSACNAPYTLGPHCIQKPQSAAPLTAVVYYTTLTAKMGQKFKLLCE